MRRKSEINVFSISALDLFASALGAFILLFLITVPNYLKSVEFSFLGVTTNAKSFVVVIDMSGSMRDYEDIMKNVSKKVLTSLKESHKFQVIGYKGMLPDKYKQYNWNDPYELKSGSIHNKSEALDFIEKLPENFGSRTPTNAVLEEALKYDAEAIILMSDGEPNTDAAEVIRNITNKNISKKEIITIALGKYKEEPQFVDFLQKLAVSNNGYFIGVSNVEDMGR